MIRIATIINTHALKGECKLYLHTDDPAARFAPGTVFTLDDGQKLRLAKFRLQKGFGYACFDGIDTVEKAQALKTGFWNCPRRSWVILAKENTIITSWRTAQCSIPKAKSWVR